MRIKSVRIRNFRAFEDVQVNLDRHTCLVGPNGAGKSSVLVALNVFFQEASNSTDVKHLSREDFHHGNVDAPVEITVTFHELSDTEKAALNHYVRHNELIVSAVAHFDPVLGVASVEQYGERLVFQKFVRFFEEEKAGKLVESLQRTYSEVTDGITDFSAPSKKPTKKIMMATLRQYEESHLELCSSARSADSFYGNNKGKLAPFIQWVYVPAVKDASQEAEELGNTALSHLLQRTVRTQLSFDDDLEKIRQRARAEYDSLLKEQQSALKDLSGRLGRRLAELTHSNVGLDIEWNQGSERSVVVSEPRATIKVSEGAFRGSLPRFGHGLQRAFLLSILQELAGSEIEPLADGGERPTLILACEEPELYQHPPQARHLASVLRKLSEIGGQILLTTHSSYFVSGETFEEIRLVRKGPQDGKSSVGHTTFTNFAARMAELTQETPEKPTVAEARLYSALAPEVAELFFCQRVVFVEGITDRAYLTTALDLETKWDFCRKAGLHIVPTNGKTEMLRLVVIAMLFGIPCFAIFDADAKDAKQSVKHERDNQRLIRALGGKCTAFPVDPVCSGRAFIWPNNIEDAVRACLGEEIYENLRELASKQFSPGSPLKKNGLFIARELTLAWSENSRISCLVDLVNSVESFCAETQV